ncbi:GGDEF domain-containing protein [Paucibacter sp. Y2R2-4]|uniref:GGDEF domain-containing protein n=1 Tax=Paucibacter sp. Y2R2-4 TaxID=2893553 RepID=UPI0021E3E820|nr:GGDEF domain-containing protein [Paucibacter sp. Y2R2-4]MCV2351203.1 GGDEF domain-containing protein [Paucibacter sp. Y2R2-4]
MFSEGEVAAIVMAKRWMKQLQAPENQARALALMALCHYRAGDERQAEQELQAAQLYLAEVRGEERLAAELLLRHVEAQGLRRAGRLEAAQQLLSSLHAQRARRNRCEAYLSAAALATVYSMSKNDVKALDHFYQALDLARETGLAPVLVNALNNLGSFESDLLNLEDGARHLHECLNKALRLGSRRQIIFAAGNLVPCLCQMGCADRALEVARLHLMNRISDDLPPSLQRQEEIAMALLESGHVDEAAAVLRGEPSIDPMSNEKLTLRTSLWARILLAQGQVQEALDLCLRRQRELEGEPVADTLPVERVNLLRVAAQAATRYGDSALGYRLLEKAFAKHEQLLGVAAKSRQMSLRFAHRMREAERERDLAKKTADQVQQLNELLKSRVMETARLQKLLQAQALEDPLTHLGNRRQLIEAGSALLTLAIRNHEVLSVAVIDLDHFKEVNDLHGHEAGDKVLRAFGDLARRTMRAEDLVCRYGGEEFVLLLPKAHAAQAVERVAQLLQAFMSLHFEDGASARFACSFSAGVADSETAGDSLDLLLSRADSALYGAKAAGRSRVYVWSCED